MLDVKNRWREVALGVTLIRGPRLEVAEGVLNSAFGSIVDTPVGERLCLVRYRSALLVVTGEHTLRIALLPRHGIRRPTRIRSFAHITFPFTLGRAPSTAQLRVGSCIERSAGRRPRAARANE